MHASGVSQAQMFESVELDPLSGDIAHLSAKYQAGWDVCHKTIWYELQRPLQSEQRMLCLSTAVLAAATVTAVMTCATCEATP